MSLLSEKPELAKEYHPVRNGDLGAGDIAAQSNMEVWWLGKCGHEWKAKVSNRFHGAGCPYCSGRYAIKGVNDLETTNPEIATEWNYEKNGELKPDCVKARSNKKAWWKCKNGHEWLAVIGSRIKNGCPYCAGKKVQQGYNDLATEYPELAREWHPYKNWNKTPCNISKGHDEKVWWVCRFGHEWQAPVYNRIKGHGCPICAKGQRSSFPEQAIYYYVKKFFPDAISGDQSLGVELDIFIPSKRVAIEYDGYKWHGSERRYKKDLEKNELCKKTGILLIRVREEGCQEMESEDGCLYIIKGKYDDDSVLKEVITEVLKVLGKQDNINIPKDSIAIYEQYISARSNKSIAEVFPELAEEWHPSKNGTITVASVTAGSDAKFWWLGKCGHEWEASPANRSKGRGCPYCTGRRVLPGYNDLATTNRRLAGEWNHEKNGSLDPSQVTINSNKKVWWKCSLGHEWQAVINSRHKNGCPFCAGKKVLKGFNDLTATAEELLIEWDYEKNKDNNPEDFSKGSATKIWWKCKYGHEWLASINSRARGRGCPECGRKSAANKLGKKVSNKENGIIFDSINEAARYCSGNSANIVACCKGKIHSAYGFHWFFVEKL